MRSVPYPVQVQASKLETQFRSNPECTHHVKLNQRGIWKEEEWSREKWLGHGSYGVVWLERCIQGDDKGHLRAVKKVQKPGLGEYYRELEAIVLFSHAKYERCFVKSFGWYDDENHIFIAMEYFPNGDLQKYLDSPLIEKEAQHIVLQILDGLQFTHDNGFTHRDLKPANILVKSKGPDWWVKIADFGISKHVIEEHTALRTIVATPSFAAPEMFGFFRPNDKPKDFYTNAVDVWALGVIAFLILSAKTPFKNPRHLNQYVMGILEFPSNALNKVSAQGYDFVKKLMMPNSEDRPKVKDCLQHPWFRKTAETQIYHISEFNDSNSSPLLDYFEPEPSAKWSTEDQMSTQKPSKLSEVPWSEKSPIPSELAISSNLTSAKPLAPFNSPESIDPKPFSDQSIQDNIITHEPHRIDMPVETARSPSRNIIASSKSTWKNIMIPSTTSDKVVKPPISSSHEIVALPTIVAHVDWRLLGTFEAHSYLAIHTVAFSPDGKLIVTGLENGSIKNWDSTTLQIRKEFKGHSSSVQVVAFSPDGTLLASGSGNEKVKLWDLATMTLRATLKCHSEQITDVKFSSDGTQLDTASKHQTVELWDLATMTIRRTLRGHLPAFLTVAFSSDGKLLASGRSNGTVILWDSITGKICHTLAGHSSIVCKVAFSPDGTLLASGSYDHTVQLWDLATMKNLHTFTGHRLSIETIAFSSTGKLLASGSWDQTVRLWDPSTGTILQSLIAPGHRINAVTFSPDGNTIAAAGYDGEILVWGVPGMSMIFPVTKKEEWHKAPPKPSPSSLSRLMRTIRS